MYSLALLLVLVVGAPYWLVRMLTSGRYRAGLAGRLGRVPEELKRAVEGRQAVWLHAVSVGEVLAATRLVAELEGALGEGWIIAVSTTTATGQALARQRFGEARVFWYPLDFAWAVRAYLRVLKPQMLMLMESELWPRMLVECERAGIPVAVVNARVSDRSFARGVKVRGVWGRMLRLVSLFLAQSEEDGHRLEALGARASAVKVAGNLKYDVRAPKESAVAEKIRELAAGRPVVVAGSTVAAEKGGRSEDEMVLAAWRGSIAGRRDALLVIAPRHPQRFGEVASLLGEERVVRASEIAASGGPADVVLLDTIGDLAAVYGIATVAFIGGSLAPRGGHNPLEAARFGVPVITGPSTTNFREVYARLADADAVVTLSSDEALGEQIVRLLDDVDAARAMGDRGRRVYEEQQGATARTVEALLELMAQRARL